MENAIAHQRKILEIQKTVEVLIKPRTTSIYFVRKLEVSCQSFSTEKMHFSV
jgi:hypothetical protein